MLTGCKKKLSRYLSITAIVFDTEQDCLEKGYLLGNSAMKILIR